MGSYKWVGEVGVVLPPVFIWWRSFGSRYVTALRLRQAGLADDSATIRRLSGIAPSDQGEIAAAGAKTKSTPLGVPWIEPEHVAPVVVFLASDEAKMVSGATSDVTGGDSAHYTA